MKTELPFSLQILNEFGIFASLIGVAVDNSQAGLTQFTSDQYSEFSYSVCTSCNLDFNSKPGVALYKQAQLLFPSLKNASSLIGMKRNLLDFEPQGDGATKFLPIAALSHQMVSPRYTHKQWQARVELSQSRNFASFCYIENNSCVASISLFVGEENRGALFDVWVAEELRGRGLGKIMLDAALKHLVALSVNICVVQALALSARFYEANRFEHECFMTCG